MANNPTLLSMPIAENGTKNAIPETQATPGNGLMSQSTGFPAECSLPLGAGGVAPDRADFNGAFYLLGGVAFMAQKGFTFNYDAGQDYYKGCVVIDPNDGNRYLCIADMTAGTVAPSADTTHDYWIFYPVGVINKRDVITTSGTYTAPVTGWYRITVKGGGGGGQGGFVNGSSFSLGGGGGGEGGISIASEYMTEGETATVVIGAGGSGGAGGASGSDGGNSTVTLNGNTYTGGGGGGGRANGGLGGNGTINGASGTPRNYSASTGAYSPAGIGGGAGGGSGSVGTQGGGGAGCDAQIGGSAGTGFAGGNGFAWFEYFAEV